MSRLPDIWGSVLFAEAQKHAAELVHIHAQEEAIVDMRKTPLDGETAAALDQEIRKLRMQWCNVFTDYNNAISRFTAAAENARKGR